jgi:hypothetical protein
MFAYAHTYAHTYIHTYRLRCRCGQEPQALEALYIHTHTYTCIHIHMHIHTYIQAELKGGQAPQALAAAKRELAASDLLAQHVAAIRVSFLYMYICMYVFGSVYICMFMHLMCLRNMLRLSE